MTEAAIREKTKMRMIDASRRLTDCFHSITNTSFNLSVKNLGILSLFLAAFSVIVLNCGAGYAISSYGSYAAGLKIPHVENTAFGKNLKKSNDQILDKKTILTGITSGLQVALSQRGLDKDDVMVDDIIDKSKKVFRDAAIIGRKHAKVAKKALKFLKQKFVEYSIIIHKSGVIQKLAELLKKNGKKLLEKAKVFAKVAFIKGKNIVHRIRDKMTEIKKEERFERVAY